MHKYLAYCHYVKTMVANCSKLIAHLLSATKYLKQKLKAVFIN